MDITVTPKALKLFTENPILAVLSTTNQNGTPQSTPLWYNYNGKHFILSSFSTRVKVTNILNNPSVSLVIVDTIKPGEKGLVVRGIAEIIDVGAEKITLDNAIRYLGKNQGEFMANKLIQTGPRVVIRITPERIFFVK